MPAIVGTAGHIDHGKTSLVRALTGQDTDRLAEEKARGISIDLGFAYLDLPGHDRVGIVDVPGHERFVRNMLAGAHGIDLVLFTVAADDGVMPQTEEHLDIVHLLGVRRGIFVVTKTDLVEAARVAAVREEIEILAAGTTLEGAPVVGVSTHTGAGLDELRGAIAAELSRSGAPRSPDRAFRLPVDRAFVLHGHGVVVTGTAIAGAVRVGDTVRVLPGGETARVRSVEVHGAAVERAVCGQRVAINLAGVERTDVRRGHVVADARLARVTDRVDVWLEVRPGARRAVRHHGRVRVHVGTAEVLAKVVLLDGRAALPAGQAGWAQLVLAATVATARGDRFILRDETARWTIAGGEVVNPFADRHRPRDPAVAPRLSVLRGPDVRAAAATLLELLPDFAAAPATLAQALGCDDADVVRALADAPGVRPIPDAAAPEAFVTEERSGVLEARVLAAVAALHAADPLAPGLDMEHARTQLPWDVGAKPFRWAIDRLVASGRLARVENLVRDPAHAVALAAADGALAARVEALLADGGFTPPDVRQLADATGTDRGAVVKVLDVLAREGRVCRVSPDLYYARRVADDVQALVRELCRADGEVTVGVFRDRIGGSRKFAIALLDWCDRSGLTLRVGDVRRLRR